MRYKAIYLITALANDFKEVAGVLAADEVTLRALGFEGVGQGQATHDVPTAHEQRSVGAKDDFLRCHGDHFSCSALNIHSARCQSSGVSMSCTRWRGSLMGAASFEKMGFPASQASARPQ